MKTFFTIICLSFFTSLLFAQSQKTTIYCTVSISGRVDYGDLANLLPDSLKTTLIIDPRKDLNLKKVNHVLLYLMNKGWKLVAEQSDVSGNGIVTTTNYYVLTREIYLNPEAR